MQIHLLGHATLFVETEDCKILIDPVLQDPFCEGLNESCPQRVITPENLPEYDFLVISHRHLDHFDLRSLAYLPKDVDVLIPQDNLIKDCLLQLGYSQIYPLADFTKVRSGSTMMMTTRSEIRVPEFGIAIEDSSGVFWNTVDTFFAPKTIEKVRANFPTIDFLLTTWHISLEGKYQYNQPVSFPYELYGYLFKLIELIAPKAIAPGAQGFKYIGDSAWQNKLVFPQTRERFCHDLEAAFPDLRERIFAFDPGDIIEFDSGKQHLRSLPKYSLSQQTSPYAQMTLDDRETVDFAPVIAGNELVDRNFLQYDPEVMQQRIKTEITNNLPLFIRDNLALFEQHQKWQVIYQLTVTFPDGEQKWYLDFTPSVITINSGRNPLANYFTQITASTLYSLIKRDRDWDYALCNGEYRTFPKIYTLTKANLKVPQNISFADPIQLQFSTEYVAENNIYQELDRLAINKVEQQPVRPSMFNLGKILIKIKRQQILNK